MNFFEQRKFIFDDRTTHDWQIIKLLDNGTVEYTNSIDDLEKNDAFLIQDNSGKCPIPNIDITNTCFKAITTAYLSLNLPEGSLQLEAITTYRRMCMGGSL